MNAPASPEITILCSNGLAGVMAELGPRFEAESGAKLALRLGTANALSKEIEDGAPFDLTVLTSTAIDQLTRDGRIVPGTRVDIARSCVGVTVRPGAPQPDIGTVEAFTRTLLAAKSIVFTSLGASGQHFASILPRLGIEAEVRRKATIPEGGLVAERVISGEIELGIQQVSEILAVPGANLVGPIPAELQKYTVFSAGLGADARNVDGAKALLRRLADASTLALATSKGMEPP
jgi:molybdate transport system substrate-binding protein